MTADSRARHRDFAKRLDLEPRLAPFLDLRWDGQPARPPTLHLDDMSAIPFLVNLAGVEEYQHRARARAEDGDMYVAVTPQTRGYEDYCATRLRLSPPRFVLAEPVRGLTAVARAAASGKAFAELVDATRAAGGMLIHPYMGVEEVWDLARQLATEAGERVTVLAPPPPITWIANDKALFSEVVEIALGRDWLVETRTTAEPAAMARLLMEMSGRHEMVALKRTRCASALGNQVFQAADLRVKGVAGAERDVSRFLERTEWPGDEEVLIVAWEDTPLSPSTQVWIPPSGGPPPRLDGIYEQILEGEARVFVGSRPSTLPAPVNDVLAGSALRVSAMLQELGYCGRCSFDHLVLGDPHGEFRVLFTECNGRWGGASTPMSLVDRLVSGPRPPYRAQDFMHRGLVGLPLTELLARVGDDLFDHSTERGRFILYNVGPLARVGKLDVIALGQSQDEAETALLEDFPRLLGV